MILDIYLNYVSFFSIKKQVKPHVMSPQDKVEKSHDSWSTNHKTQKNYLRVRLMLHSTRLPTLERSAVWTHIADIETFLLGCLEATRHGFLIFEIHSYFKDNVQVLQYNCVYMYK